MKLLLPVFLLLCSSVAFASPKQKQLTSDFEISVTYGDKTSTFQYSEKTRELKRFKNDESPKTVKLSKENAKFLRSEVLKISQQKSHEGKFCDRQNIQLRTFDKAAKVVNTVACLESPLGPTQQATALVNTLNLMY